MNAITLRRIRFWLTLVIIGLVVSGVTAFPLEWGLNLLHATVTHPVSPLPQLWPEMVAWIAQVRTGLVETYARYPFLAYGTDWLAFAHLVIAIAFIGPWRDPVKNIWVIEFGLITCVLVIPLTLIAGTVRG
ncbi:MAG: hypothetical protein JNL09_06770, partial [Anaerolineales bacterium]|nr:hypothetical protein [Anaerolineales bacterium]